MRVKIYSNEHSAWWKYNYCGYTNDESKAGVFEIEEVNKKYPYIDFDTTKEDYLVKFESLTYEELEKENNKLKKALDKACEMLEWGCPVEQDLIDDLDCENCKNTEKECWKKYFLKEVLENEKD